MKTKSMSLFISMMLVKMVFAIILICCIFAPAIVGVYDRGTIIASGQQSIYVPLLVTLYITAAVASVLIISLDRLLANIAKGKPFIQRNVTYLRIISYCCFAVSVAFIYFSLLRPFGFVIVIAAAFFGLILRVVKNVFAEAILIREENDFTI